MPSVPPHPKTASQPDIDAVVTWVDGSDPAHQEKLNRYLQSLGHRPATASASRFQETGEFAYCIASLLRFAPWLRRIHILTDRQTPPFMADIQAAGLGDRVRVVDHAEAFAGLEDCLPTFNARSLNSVVWRIPGLAEQYVFLNDDFVLLRPVPADQWFRAGRMVVRGHWSLQPALRPDKWVQQSEQGRRPGNRESQARAAALAGFRWRYLRAPHNPHTQLRSVLAAWFESHPDCLHRNCRYRLRSNDQFLADALCTHLALRQGRAVVDNRLRTLRLLMDQLSVSELEQKAQRALTDERYAFACLQSLERAAPEVQAATFAWLDQQVGSLDTVLKDLS